MTAETDVVVPTECVSMKIITNVHAVSGGRNRGSRGITGRSGTAGDRVVSCLPEKVHDEL